MHGGSQTGSAFTFGSLALTAVRVGRGGDGVDDLPVGEGIAVPAEVGLQVLGALVTREPTMNRSPASSRSRRFVDESMPASATTTKSSMP